MRVVNSFFDTLKILKTRGIHNMKLSAAKIRAYARTMDAGLRTIDEVEESYRIEVYIELIARYGWTLNQVDERYVEQVKIELGIRE